MVEFCGLKITKKHKTASYNRLNPDTKKYFNCNFQILVICFVTIFLTIFLIGIILWMEVRIDSNLLEDDVLNTNRRSFKDIRNRDYEQQHYIDDQYDKTGIDIKYFDSRLLKKQNMLNNHNDNTIMMYQFSVSIPLILDKHDYSIVHPEETILFALQNIDDYNFCCTISSEHINPKKVCSNGYIIQLYVKGNNQILIYLNLFEFSSVKEIDLSCVIKWFAS